MQRERESERGGIRLERMFIRMHGSCWREFGKGRGRHRAPVSFQAGQYMSLLERAYVLKSMRQERQDGAQCGVRAEDV